MYEISGSYEISRSYEVSGSHDVCGPAAQAYDVRRRTVCAGVRRV
ncbi:hypothetical protein [Streptomyces ipomoeae]|nr:hypothetical protein [Streptomyces ipomoeae]